MSKIELALSDILEMLEGKKKDYYDLMISKADDNENDYEYFYNSIEAIEKKVGEAHYLHQQFENKEKSINE